MYATHPLSRINMHHLKPTRTTWFNACRPPKHAAYVIKYNKIESDGIYSYDSLSVRQQVLLLCGNSNLDTLSYP